jgi:Peptidase S46
LNNYYTEAEELFYVRDAFNEVISNCEILTKANELTAFKNALETSDEESVNKEKVNFLSRMKSFYKDFNAKLDEQVLAKVIGIYFTKIPETYLGATAMQLWNSYGKDANALAKDVYANSILNSEENFTKFINQPNGSHLGLLKADKAYILIDALRKGYVINVANQVQEYQNKINSLQRQYMEAQLVVMAKERKFYPDANSTLRVAYGNVKGYYPKDGAYYGYQTYLDGALEKYIPNDYEFDMPKKLIELYNKKDYGMYGVNGKMPVCFIAANHTTGGNSGSPALDANGNLVGLNFDRVWEGTMSDINYDVSICRNIMVDIRYVLFIVDKMGGSGHLIKEMNIIK